MKFIEVSKLMKDSFVCVYENDERVYTIDKLELEELYRDREVKSIKSLPYDEIAIYV